MRELDKGVDPSIWDRFDEKIDRFKTKLSNDEKEALAEKGKRQYFRDRAKSIRNLDNLPRPKRPPNKSE